MSFYQQITKTAKRFFKPSTIFKYGFNWSPMYRRSCARITNISDDLHRVEIKLPLSYKNSNFVGSIFGGSLFSATDPIYMIQLMQILGDDYVVWDKSSIIQFKRPARKHLYAKFEFTNDEIEEIKNKVAKEQSIDLIKTVHLTDAKQHKIYCTVEKTIYVADKSYYKNRRRKKS